MIPFLIEWAERTPDAPAFIEPGYTITYGALLRQLRDGAAWLHGSGVRAGDTVAFAFEPGLTHTQRLLPLYYACFYLGAPILPLYPDVPLELRRPLAARFGARWLIAGSPTEPPPGCQRLDPAGFDPASEQRPAAPAPRGDDPARPARYEFTSGTTGEPKVVLFTGGEFSAIAHHNVKCFGWTPGERVLPVALWPGKVGVRAIAQIHTAGGALVNQRFPASWQQLGDLAAEFGVTALRAAAWQLRKLLASEPPPGWQPPPLRFLETGGAALATQEIRAVSATLKVSLRISYACTETGVIAHRSPADPFDAAPTLVPGMQGRAADDAGNPLPAGEYGRLGFRAPWLPTAYVDNERATAAQFRDGWFYPGDIGAVDAAGRVTLAGRADDTINCGAVKILPQEIEHELMQHPDIADAAVAGMPDAVMGQLPVAFVVLKRSMPLRALVEFCSARIEQARIPRVFLTVDTIPRNPDGKTARGPLEEIYRAWASKQRGVPTG